MVKNEKIYIVVKGDSFEGHVITATKDKKLAEKIRAKFDLLLGEVHIEEHENAERFLLNIWLVRFNKKGLVCEVSRKNDVEYLYKQINEFKKDVLGRTYIIVSADTKEEAIKVANEKRAEFFVKKKAS